MEKKDAIVESVINKYQQRSKLGISKYGTTLQDNNADNFLIHLQEELMDASLYIEKGKLPPSLACRPPRAAKKRIRTVTGQGE